MPKPFVRYWDGTTDTVLKGIGQRFTLDVTSEHRQTFTGIFTNEYGQQLPINNPVIDRPMLTIEFDVLDYHFVGDLNVIKGTVTPLASVEVKTPMLRDPEASWDATARNPPAPKTEEV